jgi:hypothetical protein
MSMVLKSFCSSVVVALIATASQYAAAQTSPSEAAGVQTQPPVTREQRKAETKAANKAGELVPAGQGGPKMATPTGSTMTKAERKAQAQADAQAGQMAGAGDAAAHKPAPKTKSVKTRSERKAETKAANKAGQIKSGEASSR